MNTLRLIGSIALATALVGTSQAGEWNVNKAMSSVGFSAEQQGSKFNGRFEDFTAMIDFDPSKPNSGSIVGKVMTETVNTRDHDRDAALTDRDWFNVGEYPEAMFESESIAKTDDGYEARGQLTIKGNSKPATLHFTFDNSGSGAKFDGKIMVNRFDFNVGEGWNDTSWVGQTVEVQVKLDLSR